MAPGYGPVWWDAGGGQASSPEGALVLYRAQTGWPAMQVVEAVAGDWPGHWRFCVPSWGCSSSTYAGTYGSGATCDTGQGWALNGSGQCERPDCRVDQTRDNAGQCVCGANKVDNGTACVTSCPSGWHSANPDNGQCIEDCIGRQTQAASGECKCAAAGGMVSTDYAAWRDSCVGGCLVSWGVGVVSAVGAAKFIAGSATASQVNAYAYLRFSGDTCSPPSVRIPANVQFIPKDTTGKAADEVTPDPLNKPETNQSPDACAAAGGSFGVFNGVSKCLTDSGNAMQKLTVTKASSTTQNPDGTSTVRTDTTYQTKDPATGEVTVKTVSETVNKNAQGQVTGTGSASGVTAGEQKAEASDLCKNNPALDICNNKLNKEETQKSVLDTLKQLTDPGSTDYQAVEDAKQSAQSDTDLKTETDKFEAVTDGSVVPDASAKSAWQSAISSGWFDPITRAGCAPLTATIGGRQWSWDPCPIAVKIAELSEYVLWFLVSVGTFVMFTGGLLRKS